jgi:PAS domain-containing protein
MANAPEFLEPSSPGEDARDTSPANAGTPPARPHGRDASSEDSQLAQSVRELEDIRHALDQSAIVATTDVAGRIKYVNDKFCEISKDSRAELLGQDHRILAVHGDPL